MPKIRLLSGQNKIEIKIDDLKIRKAIDTYKDKLSSAFPEEFIVEDYYLNENGSKFIICFSNINECGQKVYNSLTDYLKEMPKEKYTFELDLAHKINLIDYPHFLICGGTGSGKSFLTQLLIIQFLNKGFDVSVFDVKKSYLAFADLVDYETEPSEIINKIMKIAEEMRQRQDELKEILKDNPRALAVDCGYKPKILIIEEYIGLKTLLNKDEIKTLDNVIKEISVLARSVNINLFIIAQSSSVDLIDSSIKNNLNKIFMGFLASNIAISTFGNGVEIPTFDYYNKGFGYVQLNKVERIKVPSVSYSVNELKQLSRSTE